MKKDSMRWKTGNERFINPYQFVSLQGTVAREKAANENGLTGIISCTLTTQPPLALPDHEKPVPEKTHPVYPFFQINGTPLIPGSELRGVIRSAFEAVVPSCLSVSNASSILSARHPYPRKPGIMQFQDEKWSLYQAVARKASANEAVPENSVMRVWYELNGSETSYKIFEKRSKVTQCSNLDRAVADFEVQMDLLKKFDKEGLHESFWYRLKKDGALYNVIPLGE